MTRRSPAPVLAFSGASGAGKTTLLVKLIPALVARGLTVAAIKASGHRHAFDRPGKDSARLRAAGAVAVALQGPAELAWFGPPRPGGARALARLLPSVDLILAEGFRRERLPRVEVRRASVDAAFQCTRDRGVIAVVSDEPPPRALPWFTARDVDALADFVAGFARRGRARKHALASSRPRAHRVPGEARAPRERVMATRKTSSRKTSSGRKATRRRTGAATVSEAGRKGGRRTLERRGPEFYSRIGRKGGKSSGNARRNASRRAGRARSATRSGSTRRKSARR